MSSARAPRTVPVREAATVMLVRDAADGGGLEVFMLRRNLQSDFVGGAYVFPGGGVDDHDRHRDLDAVCTGRTDADASRQLEVERGGLAFWVAAIRESFEEAGILLARTRDGALVDFADPAVDARFREHRRLVDRGERRLVDICVEEGLQLAVDAIHYFAHWITPEGLPRRYDTRFFVAAPPLGQVPLHDDNEVIANLWIRPSDALAQWRAGEFDLRLPTERSLAALARFDSAAEVLDAAAAVASVPGILPQVVEMPQGTRIPLPGDPGYDDAVATPVASGDDLSTITRASPAPAERTRADATTGADHGA